MHGDFGSLASELYAFECLGLTGKACIRTEQELLEECNTGPVPEGIWECAGQVVSVEVKRIAGNTLPIADNPDGRRQIFRRGRIIWPWVSTVHYAICKCTCEAVTTYNVDVHYAVFLVPESMNTSARERTYRHIQHVAKQTYSALTSSMKLGVKVKAVMLTAPDVVFDRLH